MTVTLSVKSTPQALPAVTLTLGPVLDPTIEPPEMLQA
jgi:hypothetical protein